MIGVCLIGSRGKMGSALKNFDQTIAQILCEIDRDTLITQVLQSYKLCDCIVDFSSGQSVHTIATLLQIKKVPVILGTTAHTPDQKRQIQEFADLVPVLQCANFSVGISILGNMLTQNKQALACFDTHLTEIHHEHKKDAPSGTALYLSTLVGECTITAIRKGEEIGTHIVTFSDPFNQLTLVHKALSRECFCDGVYRAIPWILTKECGYYTSFV